MAFNIKNEETIQIARGIASETGTSIATVFDEAVRERRERLDRDVDAKRQRILSLAADIRGRMSPALLQAKDPVADLLYDKETGLPA